MCQLTGCLELISRKMSVPKRKQLSKATRLEVLNKYDNHCAYCGCELTYEQLNVDHKIDSAILCRIWLRHKLS